MARHSLAARWRYAFDNVMSRGAGALVLLLGLASLAFIAAASALIHFAGLAPAPETGAPPTYLDVLWLALMRTLDSGTVGGDSGSWPFLLAMLAVTFGGIFVISTFIGVLTTGLDARLEQLRRGRSQVVESGHTVILGWSSQVMDIVSELACANENRRRACVVVLAPRDKVEMEEAIAERVPEPGKTRVVCRSGEPSEMTDLDRVSVQTAKSIIVLGGEGGHGDSRVIKTLLALTNSPTRREEPYHIVTEIRDPKNLEAARIAGRGEAELVAVGELISRITVQTCRQSGLSTVYTELLDFGGDEIYFHEEAELVGKTVGEALFAFEDASVMGIARGAGRVELLPSLDTRIEANDQLIVIARDEDAIGLSGKTTFPVDNAAIRQPGRGAAAAEASLILGWNDRLGAMLRELDQYVPEGSVVGVVAEKADGVQRLAELTQGLTNQRASFRHGDVTDRALLESLKLDRFHHIIVLCDDTRPASEADARTLVTLLHLRDIAERTGKRVPVVSEMLDVRNRDLATVTRADDFVVSDKLVGLLMTQISENKLLAPVFTDLFDPQGAEIYLKPIDEYVALGQPLSFYTALEAARRRGEIAIGYRVARLANEREQQHGIAVNPVKTQTVSFAPGDKLIVLAMS